MATQAQNLPVILIILMKIPLVEAHCLRRSVCPSSALLITRQNCLARAQNTQYQTRARNIQYQTHNGYELLQSGCYKKRDDLPQEGVVPQEDDPAACVTEAGCLEPLFQVPQQRIDHLLNRFSIPAFERARKERENAVEDDGRHPQLHCNEGSTWFHCRQHGATVSARLARQNPTGCIS